MPKDYSLPYQTNLSPEDEVGFREWIKRNDVPFNPDENNPKSE